MLLPRWKEEGGEAANKGRLKLKRAHGGGAQPAARKCRGEGRGSLLTFLELLA
jgi:hypothetical protein